MKIEKERPLTEELRAVLLEVRETGKFSEKNQLDLIGYLLADETDEEKEKRLKNEALEFVLSTKPKEL